MKAYLMFRNRHFDRNATPCYGKETLTADLELKRILSCMARGDEIIAAACSSALFCPLQSIEEILYRQAVLRDVLHNPEAVRGLYGILQETFERKRSSFRWLSTNYFLSSTFSSAVDLLKLYTEMLMKLRAVADQQLAGFQSEGFVNLLTMIQKELNDDYFKEVRIHLDELNENDGMLISAALGSYDQGISYVLRRKNRSHFRRRWAFAPSYTVAPRDDAGATDLGKRRERAINEVTNALAQAAEHIEGFFTMLQNELAFYVGCLNLSDSLRVLGMPACIPELLPEEQEKRSWKELYDISLALTKNDTVTGNWLSVEDKKLYLITGANQGGKSTFLRSLGQAQLMAQCGMFVGAETFLAPVRAGVFTHFKKEEDTAMKSGKLDEELNRMDALADHLQSGSLMLFNESFAATNEREGSEINRQITQALADHDVEVFSVTHLYTYAADFSDNPDTQFLRAERLDSGERTFKIVPGKPLQTAFGEDLYRKIFTGSGA
jgi:Mismatch repair ATPase (MutS family)